MNGKFSRGNISSAKLTPSLVLEIRLEYERGMTQGALARKYQISIGHIGRIVRGEVWQHYAQVPERGEVEHDLAIQRMAEQAPPSQEAEASLNRLRDMLGENFPTAEEVAREALGPKPKLEALLEEINEGPKAAAKLLEELEKDSTK